MGDEVERRLATAAQALHEYEVTSRRYADLQERIAAMSARVKELRTALADEEKDVERLEGVSLTRLLVALRGSREDTLARERTEADAARLAVAEAQARLDAVVSERDAVRERLDRLAGAGRAYAAALDAKERYLHEHGDPRAVRLLELADERGRLAAESRELAEARHAADEAAQALSRAHASLGSASSWSTYDTFFGGGMISSAIKHSRLDDAAAAAAHADRCLAVMRTELADVQAYTPVVTEVAVDGLTRFADIWFDNIFTDHAVRGKIRRAQSNVDSSIAMVAEVQRRLAERMARVRERISAIAAERVALVSQP